MRGKRVDVRESLRSSFKDGIFAAFMAGITEHYATPLALFLGATVQQVGLISALPHLLASVSQFLAVRVIHWIGGRLKLLVRLVLCQASLILCIAILPWLDTAQRVELLTALLILIAVCGGLAGPAWGSLITDYIPSSKRGRYFGWRNRTVGAVTLASIIISGLVLYSFGEISYSAGFCLLFGSAALARFASGYFISRMDEPPHRSDPASDFTFLMFIARFRQSNFLRFVVFSACLTFATYLSAPFFAVFMLRDLQFSYLTYMGLQVCSSFASLVALPLWGRHADLVGNVRVLRLSSFPRRAHSRLLAHFPRPCVPDAGSNLGRVCLERGYTKRRQLYLRRRDATKTRPLHCVLQRYQWRRAFSWLRSRRFSRLPAAATARLRLAQPFCCFVLLQARFLPAARAFLSRG